MSFGTFENNVTYKLFVCNSYIYNGCHYLYIYIYIYIMVAISVMQGSSYESSSW